MYNLNCLIMYYSLPELSPKHEALGKKRHVYNLKLFNAEHDQNPNDFQIKVPIKNWSSWIILNCFILCKHRTPITSRLEALTLKKKKSSSKFKLLCTRKRAFKLLDIWGFFFKISYFYVQLKQLYIVKMHPKSDCINLQKN